MRNFKMNVKNNEFLTSITGFVIGSGLAFALVNATGAFDKAECPVVEEHAHLYVNEEGFTRYINSEFLRRYGYGRQDEYIKLSEDEVDLYSFINKKKLINIDDNANLILAIQNNNHDYLEYEYTYEKRVTRNAGKTHYRTWRTRTGWTSNPDNVENELSGTWKDLNFTGNTRLAHYIYKTYKVELNEKGKYVLVECPVVEDIHDALGKDLYIKHDFYEIIYVINYEEINNQKKLVNP